MLAAWLTTVVLTVGPLVDPLAGSTVDAGSRERLPSGGTLAAAADLWFVEWVNLRPSGGGIELVDAVSLSAYGWSWTETAFLLEELELTDPARPGTPLLELHHHLWRELRLSSVWDGRPVVQWRLPAPALAPAARVQLSGGGEARGGTWVPSGLMDREPATPFGSSTVRRGVRSAFALDGEASAGGLRLALEHRALELRYPTLRDLSGRLVGDPASRTTLVAHGGWPASAPSTELVAAWQRTTRRYDGAQHRHPLPLTAAQEADALALSLSRRLVDRPALRLRAGLGLGWRRDAWTPNGATPIVRDLEQEWTWMQRPDFTTELERLRVDGHLRAELGAGEPLQLALRAGHATVSSLAAPRGDLVGTSWRRGPDAVARSVSVDVYAPARPAEERLTTARLDASHARRFAGWRFTARAGADLALIHAGAGLAFLSPAAGLAAEHRLADGELIGLLRHEPVPLTAQAAAFLDPARPSFRRYTWADDGDLVPEPGEAGTLLAAFGGATHTVSPRLRRPTSSQLSVGWRSPTFGPFRATAHGFARVLLDRLVVRLRGPAAQSYQRSTVGAVAGGDPIDADLPVYLRTPGSEGRELYRLENARRAHHHVGAELQLVSEPERPWFLNLMATGYWSLGCAPFGLFADRNDPGIIDPVTADPNARVNQCGSLDAGRAYHIKLLGGLRPTPALDLGLALRYRDGEPMTRILVVDGLPQGPTALMAVARGDPIPRYTFHMTVDLRAAYRFTAGPWTARFGLDLFNLLGSGTEILEDVASGADFRRSLEMMPGRTLMATLSGAWR